MAFSMISKSFESFNLHKMIQPQENRKEDLPMSLTTRFSLAVAAEGQSTESKEPVELAARELRREFQVIQEVPQTVGKPQVRGSINFKL